MFEKFKMSVRYPNRDAVDNWIYESGIQNYKQAGNKNPRQICVVEVSKAWDWEMHALIFN